MNYFVHFIIGENGIETIEFIGILAVAAALVAIATNVGSTLIQHANTYETKINDALPD